MRAIEFETSVNASGQLEVPLPAAERLVPGTRARVIVLLPDGDDPEWDAAAARNISAYYAPQDAIYDDYPRGGSVAD